MIKKQLFALLILPGLVLGSYKGYVALFDPGENEPKQIFPYQVQSLPLADQQALEEGIPVRDMQRLQQLLEDFLS